MLADIAHLRRDPCRVRWTPVPRTIFVRMLAGSVQYWWKEFATRAGDRQRAGRLGEAEERASQLPRTDRRGDSIVGSRAAKAGAAQLCPARPPLHPPCTPALPRAARSMDAMANNTTPNHHPPAAHCQ